MLQFDLDGISLLFSIDGYRGDPKDPETWCKATFDLHSPQINLSATSMELFTIGELRRLYNVLKLAEEKRGEELPTVISFTEPDISFSISSEDIWEMIFAIWHEGALTGNSVHVLLAHDDLHALYEYIGQWLAQLG